jgi:hypothetical protein
MHIISVAATDCWIEIPIEVGKILRRKRGFATKTKDQVNKTQECVSM